MGLFKGNPTFTRYKVSGDSQVRRAFTAGMVDHAFQEIDAGPEEISVGWVQPNDMFNNDVDYAICCQEPYILLGLRIDQRKVKASVLKKEHRRAIKDYLLKRDVMTFDDAEARKQAAKPLDKATLDSLKEQARQKLLMRLPSEPTVVDVIWDTQGGHLWVGTQSEKLLSLFEDKFRLTFGLQPEPTLLYLLAWDALESDHHRDRLAELFNVQPALSRDMISLTSARAASLQLGHEYLSWLWYMADTADEADIIGLGRAKVAMGSALRLAHPVHTSEPKVAINSDKDEPLTRETLAEAFQALRAGKRPTMMSFSLEVGDFSCLASLQAGATGLSGLSMSWPRLAKGDDWWSLALERISLIDKSLGVVDGLLKAFLTDYCEEGGSSRMRETLSDWAEEG